MRNNKGNIKMMVLCILLSISTAVNAQTRYWVGGSGNWTDMQHWASTSGGNGGASLPTSSSDVIITNKSGLSDGGNIVLTGNIEVGALLWNDAPLAGFSGNYDVTVNGVLNFNSSNGWNGTINLASKEKSLAIFAEAKQKYNVNFLQSSIYVLGSNLSTTGKVDVSKANDVFLDNYSIDAKSYKKKKTLLKAAGDEGIKYMSKEGITIGYAITSTTCTNPNAGAIEIVSVEGTSGGTLSYIWSKDNNPNNSISNENKLEGVSAGLYYVLIIDGPTAVTFDINLASNSVSLLESSINPVGATCYGSTGSISFLVINGVRPYNYSIDSKDGLDPSHVYTGEFSANGIKVEGIASDTYTLKVTDAEGCDYTYSKSIVIEQPADFNVFIENPINPTCNGSSDGSFKIGLSLNESDFEFSIDGEHYSTNPQFDNLKEGEYNIYVRRISDNSCVKNTSQKLEYPEKLSVDKTIQSKVTLCSDTPDGKIAIVSPTGGHNKYEFSIDLGETWVEYTSTPFTGLSAKEYTILMRDQDYPTCSIDLGTVTVEEELPLTATVNHTDATCKENNDGSITLTNPQGGSGSHEYSVALQGSVDNWSSSSVYENLPSGIYVVKIRDKNNPTCEKTLDGAVKIGPDEFSATATSVDATCPGNGRINITDVVGGDAYEYSYDNGITWTTATSAEVSGSIAGISYSVMMRIAGKTCNAVTLNSVTVKAPDAMKLTVNVENGVTCYGGNDGKISLSLPSGGTAPYSYSISKGADDWKTDINDPSFSALTEGLYSVRMKDANGCEQTIKAITDLPFNIIEPEPLVATIASPDKICFGETSGSLTISEATGGTEPYQYQLLQNGVIVADWQTSSTFASLPEGSYSVKMRDANGCELTIEDDNTTITVKNKFEATLGEPVHIKCIGEPTGSIPVVITSGTAPYYYDLGKGAGFVALTGTSITGLVAGDYNISLKDASGCAPLSLGTVTIEPATALNATATGSFVGCAGDLGGQIIVNATGGKAPYTYSINGGEAQTSATFSNLAGLEPTDEDYSILVTDNNGCTASTDARVENPKKIAINVGVEQVTCGETTGSIIINSVTNGTAPYQYSLNDGAYATLGTLPAKVNMPAGEYTVVVKDINGCLSDKSMPQIIDPIVPFVATLGEPENVKCFGESNGTIPISITSGKAPYTYNIGAGDVPLTGNTITGLPAGTYNVTLKDASTCSIDLGSVEIRPATALTATATGSFVGCAGDLGGQIIVNATGGNAPYTYSINGGEAQTSATFSNLAGLEPTDEDYSILVTDNNGCTASTDARVENPKKIAINVGVEQVTCGETTGSIIINSVTNGTAPYQYSLNDGAYSTLGALPAKVNMPAGEYTVVVKDINGCLSDKSMPQQIDPIVPFVATLGEPENVKCFGESNGTIPISITSGKAPYTYNIGAGDVPLTGNKITGLAAGDYNVSLKDATGCVLNLGNATVNQPTTALSATATGSFSGCLGDLGGQITIVAQGGTAPYTYSVDNKVSFGAENQVLGLAVGSYTGKIFVKDASGCTAPPVSDDVTIIPPDPIVINDIPEIEANCNGDAVSITITATGGVPPLTYAVDDSEYQSNSTFTGVLAGTHTLKVKDANGCSANRIILVQEPNVLAVNATRFNATCFNANNGRIRVTPTGGTAPYTVTLSPTAAFTDGEFANLAVGTYDVTVTDKNGCVQSENGIIIENPDQIVVGKPDSKNPTCLTGGYIEVTATGGTQPLTYKLISKENGKTIATQIGNGKFENVSNGLYTVAVTDANGCDEVNLEEVIRIMSSSTITFSNLTPVNNLCHGDANGSISATISGIIGAPTITLTKDGAAVPLNITPNGSKFDVSATGLSGGKYTLTAVGDGDPGCPQSQDFSLFDPKDLVFTTPIVTSPGTGNNGSIAISVIENAGTAPYNYTLQPGGISNSTGIFNGLAEGDYTITVEDANHCTQTSTTISLSNLTAVATGSSVNCKGDATGTITVDIQGGTAPYSIEIIGKNGSTYTTNDLKYVVSNLVADDYLVVVTDAKGNNSKTAASVTEPILALAVGIVDGTPNLCANDASGFIEFAINGGTNPYVIAWAGDNSGNPSTIGTLTGNVISELTPDHYTVTITDVNGCVATAGHTIEFNGAVAIDVKPISSACGTANTGSIIIEATGGDGNYTYSIDDGGTFNAENTFNNLLDEVEYKVVAADGAGCRSTVESVTLHPSSEINIAVQDVIPAQCAQGGQIVVDVIGGSGNLKYELIKKGSGIKGTNDTGIFNDLPIGVYTVRISDLGGTCPAAMTKQLEVKNNGGVSDLTYDSYESNPGKCFGEKSSVKFDLHDAVGTVNVELINKTTGAILVKGTDYSLDIQPGADASSYTIIASELLAGDYSMYVSDDNACPVLVQFGFRVITTQLEFESITKQDPSSKNSANGSITAVAVGGMAPYLYTLTKNNEDGTTSVVSENHDGIFTELRTGAYIVTVEDAYHCVITSDEQILGALSDLSIDDVYVTDPKCNNGEDGTIEIVADGNKGAISYSIDGGITFQDSSLFENLSAGDYNVFIKDEAGATAETIATVNNPSPVVLTIEKVITPSGSTKGSIKVIATGGTGFYNYVLTNESTGVEVSNVTTGSITVNFNSLPIGVYTVRATDENGCEAVIGPIDFQELALVLSATDASCANGDATISVAIKGGLSPFVLKLFDPEGNAVGEQVETTERAYTFENLNGYKDLSKKYKVTIEDATGSTDFQFIHVDSPDGIDLNVEAKSNKLCFGNTDGFIKLDISGGSPDATTGYNVVWTNSETVGSFDKETSTISGLSAGNYIVSVTDANGCRSSELNVDIEEHSDIVYTIDKGDASCGVEGSSTNGYAEIVGLEADVEISFVKEGDETSFAPNPDNKYRFENLEVGNYILTFKRGGECPVEKVESVRIESTVKFNFELIEDPNAKKLCYGASDGEIKVNITGGQIPYQRVELYKDGTATALRVSETNENAENDEVWKQTFSNLEAGKYQILVVDANGCTQAHTIEIEQLSEIVVNIDEEASNLKVWCKNDPSESKLVVSATGGTGPYIFAIEDTEFESVEGESAEFKKIPYGLYNLTVFDAEGCSAEKEFTVDANRANIDYDPTNAACRYFNDPENAKLYGGKALIEGVIGDYGADAAYSIIPLSDGLSLQHGGDTQNMKINKEYGISVNDEILGLNGGINNLALTVKNEDLTKTCVIDTISIITGVVDENDFSITAYPKDAVVCSNSAVEFGVKIDKLESTATTYFVKWDEKEQVIVDAGDIINKDTPVANEGVLFTEKLISSYSVSHIARVSVDGVNGDGEKIPNLCYDVDTAYAKAYPSNMEFTTMPASVSIRMVDSTGYFIRVPEGIETGVILSFNPEIENPEISWSPEEAAWFTPIPFVDENNDTLYTSIIQINDKFLSQETIRAVLRYELKDETCIDTLGLILMPMNTINPPNAFTPNGDGFNDVWRVVYGEEVNEFPMLEVEIYNRWGSRVYSAKPYKNNWDGKRKGKDLPTGTYYYVIKPHRGNLPTITGSVSIIR